MKKLGFVIPWFGFDIPGGAEAVLKGLAVHLHQAGVPLEILTTCVYSFPSDWNVNYYKPGVTIERGIKVKRFKVRKRNTAEFDRVNRKLMDHQMPLTNEEEKIFVNEMINSPDLYRYIRKHEEEYGLFVFIPYMFGTTYFGIQACYDKAVMIPCFHNESYVYLRRFRKCFSRAAGMIFHAQPEAELASEVYDLRNVCTETLGGGVYTEFTYDAERFRHKYKIGEPFLLYAGRKDAGKNISLFIDYFREYKYRNNNYLKLVLIGGGNVEIPEDIREDVIDLGFVDVQDKFDAYAAASLLCQPSVNESFSLVIMESWICGRPVLVHGKCAVTRHFAVSAAGGLYFDGYPDFEGAVNYMLDHPDIADRMGQNGREFVQNHFSWKIIVEKYVDYFKKLMKE